MSYLVKNCLLFSEECPIYNSLVLQCVGPLLSNIPIFLFRTIHSYNKIISSWWILKCVCLYNNTHSLQITLTQKSWWVCLLYSCVLNILTLEYLCEWFDYHAWCGMRGIHSYKYEKPLLKMSYKMWIAENVAITVIEIECC